MKENNKAGFSLQDKLVLLLGIIAFCIYANTLVNGYVLDDLTVVTDNTPIDKGFSGIVEIFRSPYPASDFVAPGKYYRPLAIVTFALEYKLFNGNPMIGHLINILLFAGCVMLLFVILDTLFAYKKTSAAFIAALFFALHPINTEVVAHIKNRDQLLCFFFGFLSLISYIKYMESQKVYRVIVGSLYFLLSLFSHETSLVFLAVLPFIFFFYSNGRKKQASFILVSSIFIGFLFIVVRYAILQYYSQSTNFENNIAEIMQPAAPSDISKMATAILVLGRCAIMLVVPYPLICDYSYNTIPFADFGNVYVLMSLCFYLFIIILTVYRLIKFKADPFAFGLLFFLLPIFLFNTALVPVDVPMSEHLLLFPSIGFCFIISLVIEKWITGPGGTNELYLKNKKLLALLPTLLIYTTLAFIRNNDWANNQTLLRADIQKAPGNAKLNYSLGDELLTTADNETDIKVKTTYTREGVEYMKKSLAILPDNHIAHTQIGTAYLLLSQFDSAEFHYLRSLTLAPYDTLALKNLGILYFDAQKFELSLQVCQIEIDRNPAVRKWYNKAGMCYLNMGKYDSAIFMLEKARLIEPDFNPTYEGIAVTYKIMGKEDSAKKYEEIVKRVNPQFRF